MQSSKIDRIKDLVEQLNAASESYYAKDQEIMNWWNWKKRQALPWPTVLR